jgi:hypothetical protein
MPRYPHPLQPPALPSRPPRVIVGRPPALTDKQRAAKREQHMMDAQDERLERIVANQQFSRVLGRRSRKVSLRSLRKDDT